LTSASDPGRSDPLVIVAPADALNLLGQLEEVAPPGTTRPGAGPLRRLSWTRDEAAEAATADLDDVVYRFRTADGRTYTKQWILPKDPEAYDLRLRLGVEVPEVARGTPVTVELLATGGMLPEEPAGGMVGGPAVDLLHRTKGQKDVVDGQPFGFASREVRSEGLEADPLVTLAMRSQYFLVGLYAAPDRPALPVRRIWGGGEAPEARTGMEQSLVAWFRANTGREAGQGKDEGLMRRIGLGRDLSLYAWAVMDLPTQAGAGATEAAFYVGPIERSVLRSDAYDALAPVITYPGAFDWLANLLLWIYDQWRLLLGSVGLAVILMTLTVRGGLMPISIKNQLGMRRYGRKVQALKPKLKVLQERYAGNPTKLREQTMLLYKEHGIGFPTGCLMMLLQIPIFFALFASLRVEYTLRGVPFLWVPELSGPDRLVDLPRGFPLISAINLLPILMIVLSVLHMRTMPKPTDEQQAQQMRMMKWLPIVFAVLLYEYTAALALYMVISSAIALIESRIVKRRDDADGAAVPTTAWVQ
jgi:YidC/Oxa1 family membrane protein insertase